MDKDLELIAKLLKERFPKSRIEVQPRNSFGPDSMITLNFKSTDDAIAAIECDGSVTLVAIDAANSDYAKAVSNKRFEQKFKYQTHEHLASKFAETSGLLLKDMQELGLSLTVRGAKNPLAGITKALKKEIGQ